MRSPRGPSDDFKTAPKKEVLESPKSVANVEFVDGGDDFDSFEKRREANIARNEAFLRSLGLIGLQEDLKTSLATDHHDGGARKRGSGGKRRRSTGEGGVPSVPRKARVASPADGADLPRRSSRRLRGEGTGAEGDAGIDDIATDIHASVSRGSNTRLRSRESVGSYEIQSEVDKLRSETYDIVDDYEDAEDEGSEKKRITSSALLDYIRSSSNPEHEDFISNHILNHTVMRINTMSIAALALRLRKLKDREKILTFYYGLLLAGLPELADVARKIATQLKIATFSDGK